MTHARQLTAAAASAVVATFMVGAVLAYVMLVPDPNFPEWDAPMKGAGIAFMFLPAFFIVWSLCALAMGYGLQFIANPGVRATALGVLMLVLCAVLAIPLTSSASAESWLFGFGLSLCASAFIVGTSTLAWWGVVRRAL